MNAKLCSECGNRLHLQKNKDGSIICKTCYEDLHKREVKLTADIKEANHIADHIFLGSEKCASDFNFLAKNNITRVLVIGRHIEQFFETDPRFTYLQIPINDETTENIRQYFDQCFAFIEERLAKDGETEGNLLVHCVAGMSRSPTVVIAYLMEKYSLSAADALNFVKHKRSIVNPNAGFLRQLKKYEEELKTQPKWCQIKNQSLHETQTGLFLEPEFVVGVPQF